MKDTKFKVSEIFKSIDGEGIRSGYVVTFIRLFGCNLNCTYCDSSYACKGQEYQEMSLCDILDKVKQLNCPKITLTGGEPLLNLDNTMILIQTLISHGYEINIETNGSIDISSLIELPVILTVDHKSISSNMSEYMIKSNIDKLRENDVLKFVVQTAEDLQQMVKILQNHKNIKCSIYVSPVFDKIDPATIVEFLKSQSLYNVRIQLQLHKIIWDSQKRGV